MYSRACVALGAIAALCAISSVAHAQVRARTAAAARGLFQQGVACTDQQDWTCAVDRFGQAYELRPSPVIGSNYAIALMHLERWVEASEAFRAVERDESASAELRAEATHYIAEIAPRLGRVTIRTTGPRAGVTITMNGNDNTALLDVAVPSDPGDHLVEARRDGAVVASATVHVESGASVTVELAIPEPAPVEEPVGSVAPVVAADPAPVAVLDSTPVEPAHQPEVYEEWWFWTIVGVGVAGIGAGVTAGVLTSQGTVPPMGSLGTIDARL